MNQLLDLSLVIPALNESQIILKHIDELHLWMQNNIPQIRYEILVVNDGSTDGMGEMLDTTCMTDKNLRVLHHPMNYGRGKAVRTAMENSNSATLIALDADLSYAPYHIERLLTPLLKGHADLTLASPYHPDGTVENVPAFRAWLSRWGNRVLSHSFQNKYYTSTCVVRGYTRKLIDHLELVSTTKDLHLEVLYKTELLGFTIKEVPADLVWRDKNRGKSKHNGIKSRVVNNSIIKMRKAIISHLVFNFFSKPKLLFLGPIALLLLSSIYGISSLSRALIHRWMTSEQDFATILRETLVGGGLTLTLTISSLILLLAFGIFLFLASQAKKYSEENYILSARTNYRLKILQRSLQEKN